MEIGTRVKKCIERKKVTQKHIAEMLGITPQALNNYLQGLYKFPAWVICDIARILDVSTDYLLGFTEEPNPPLTLTESERNLMVDFRKLSKPQKELIAANVRLMKEQNKR